MLKLRPIFRNNLRLAPSRSRLSPQSLIIPRLLIRQYHPSFPRLNPPKITKEQLLKNANNWLSRLQIRFKWLLKKSNRPFNTDDYSAFFSWLVISNALLIFLGTTTFFSLVIFSVNTVFAQEFVARKFGEVITKNSSLSVVFENAIVPSWNNGKIQFKGVLVSRRPKISKKFVKNSKIDGKHLTDFKQQDEDEEYDDGNYTQYDISIQEINVTLSFRKWVNGKGIIDTMEMKGVRGVIDRTHVVWDVNDSPTNYKNIAQPGDFEIDNFKMSDLLVELKQPNNFRPFNVELYNCELNQLRKHWLFYDFLNATALNGAYDGSLFTIHKRQRFDEFKIDEDFKLQRLRIDGLNIDHLNTGLPGPLGWIDQGKVDMIGDLLIPNIPTQDYLTTLKSNFINNATRIADPKVELKLNIKLHNVKSIVPFQSSELSYINYALVKPIVAYINSNNTFIEIDNLIIKDLKDFEGSWTVYDCLLMDDISIEVYKNFANYVIDEESRLTRMKKVTFWSAQLLIQLLLFSIAGLT
ncbi:mitochondrial distribution and morphology protein 31 [[Candida] jaroonii]|uniref:Mitochondrial distribution and morphology protein 31 n=1 Tax=[Candida] jaroonii TaxID=467808 RepID=A0ACA9Y0M6_9ASCO|nr:mitochondrial distribution and morphology protein 31 [[Candida] jaroonii]